MPQNPQTQSSISSFTPPTCRARASSTRELCGWRTERIGRGACSYLALELGGRLGGGIVECEAPRPLWLPYVEVARSRRRPSARAQLGASVLLEPREGPAGWRSVVAAPAGGEIAFWQPK